MAKCPRQIVPNKWTGKTGFQTYWPIQENDLSPSKFVFTRGMTKVRVSEAERNSLVGVYDCTRSERY